MKELDGSNPDEKALVVSTIKRKHARKRIASLDWMIELETKAYKREQAESSRQQGNNS